MPSFAHPFLLTHQKTQLGLLPLALALATSNHKLITGDLVGGWTTSAQLEVTLSRNEE